MAACCASHLTCLCFGSPNGERGRSAEEKDIIFESIKSVGWDNIPCAAMAALTKRHATFDDHSCISLRKINTKCPTNDQNEQ